MTYLMWSHIGEDDPSTRLWYWVSTTLPVGFGPLASLLSLPHWWGCLPPRDVTRWRRDRKSLDPDIDPPVCPQVRASRIRYLGTFRPLRDILTWWLTVANEEFSWQERLLSWGLSCGLALFPARIEVCMPSKEEGSSQLYQKLGWQFKIIQG